MVNVESLAYGEQHAVPYSGTHVDDTRECVDAAVANPLGFSIFGHSVRSKAMQHGNEWATRAAELI